MGAPPNLGDKHGIERGSSGWVYRKKPKRSGCRRKNGLKPHKSHKKIKDFTGTDKDTKIIKPEIFGLSSRKHRKTGQPTKIILYFPPTDLFFEVLYGNDTRDYLLMLSNGRLLLQMGDSSGPQNFHSTSTPVLSNDAWNHIAVTFDRGSSIGGRMYADGRVVYTFNPTSRRGSIDTSDSLRIGQQEGVGKYFLGYLDELTFYKRAVSANDIAAEYRANDWVSVTNLHPPPAHSAIRCNA